MLLQRICLASISLLPKDRGQVAHCREAVGMLLAELARTGCDDRFEEFARCVEVALSRNGPSQIVDRSERLEADVAVELTHLAEDILLKPACLRQVALRGHRDSQLANSLQRVGVLRAQAVAAPGDNLFLEFACSD